VLTGVPSIDVAHIYPFCLLKREKDAFGIRHSFWNMLKNFWPEEKVAAWEAELFPNGTHENGLETARNLISLSKDAHDYWNKGAFALKPIFLSDDKTTLTIQFFWQAKHQEIQPTMSLLTTPLSTKDLDSNNGARLTNYRVKYGDSFKLIKSGDIFELKTDDAEARPLPSFTLLEMQWFLQRVMGMAGAADIEEDLGEEDWDDEISNLGLDEVGDASFISGMSDPGCAGSGLRLPTP
jgi:HNH endonuclease